MSDIQKFAATEAKALLKIHSQTIFQWASVADAPLTSPQVKEALLGTISRMYELVEGLVEEKAKGVVLMDFTVLPKGEGH